MPKNARVDDTITFLETSMEPNLFNFQNTVAARLRELEDAVPPRVVDAMHMGTTGSELERKYRRALVLVMCMIHRSDAKQAQTFAKTVAGAQLNTHLVAILRQTLEVLGTRRHSDVFAALKDNPSTFLTNNRIKIGRGGVTTSTKTRYEFSWDARQRFYLFEPPVQFHYFVNLPFYGYNVHVQKYGEIDDITKIPAATIEGDICLTTQLSGCTVLYRVSGSKLQVAHVNPPSASDGLGLSNTQNPNTGKAIGVQQAAAFAKHGNLAGDGGNIGLFGMVESVEDCAFRLQGGRTVKDNGTDAAMRVHGYCGDLGNAYFIAVCKAGRWEIFGQQNNPGRPNEGVSRLTRLYPL